MSEKKDPFRVSTIWKCIEYKRFGLTDFSKPRFKGLPIQITDRRMTRFFITMEEAVSLCIMAAEQCLGGEIFVQNMGSCDIQCLARAFLRDTSAILRKSERPQGKASRRAFSETEAQRAVLENGTYVIMPEIMVDNKLEQLKRKYGTNYIQKSLRSDENLLSFEQVVSILEKCNGGKRLEDKILLESYEQVGGKILSDVDFSMANLKSSLSLFTDDSIRQRKPVPRHLEVVAILSGLSFSTNLQEYLVSFQKKIDDIIPNALKYWVDPQNFGVEYLVLKWPDTELDHNQVDMVLDDLGDANFPGFQLIFDGIQVHRDGCVIARGFDQFGGVRKIREFIRERHRFIPQKQSNWAHVPIGVF